VPAAVGAQIGLQDRQVWALVGDGSFQFGVQALWTAARYEVPVGVVIWNNGQYQANRRFLHAYGGRAAETGKYIGCNLESPEIDNVALAKGYGVEGERVAEPGELGSALDRCLRAMGDGRPYVLDVRVERRFGGAESTWYDFFSVAKRQARTS
jgi:benzoylformate decarboxylase